MVYNRVFSPNKKIFYKILINNYIIYNCLL